jgi:hypothetical protein
MKILKTQMKYQSLFYLCKILIEAYAHILAETGLGCLDPDCRVLASTRDLIRPRTVRIANLMDSTGYSICLFVTGFNLDFDVI